MIIDKIMQEFEKELNLHAKEVKSFFLAKFTQLAKECIPEECHCPDDHSIGFNMCRKIIIENFRKAGVKV